MAPGEDTSEPPAPSVEADAFVQAAPQTNGGEPAPPESFGIAGDPEAAAREAAETTDPRGDEAPESDDRNEPSG